MGPRSDEPGRVEATSYFFNNTIIDSNFAGLWLTYGNPGYGNPDTIGYSNLFNNLVQQTNFTRPAFLVDAGLKFPSFSADYNFYDTSNSQHPVNWEGSALTFPQYQQTSGWDAHGISVLPSFQNPAGGDYHLLGGSAGNDSGTVALSFYPAGFNISTMGDFDGHVRPDDGGGQNIDTGGLETASPCVNNACALGAPGSWAYDSAIKPVSTVQVTLPHGVNSKSVNVRASVQNTDKSGTFPHRIQLAASDGTCPAGTVAGLPSFPPTNLTGSLDTVYLHPMKTSVGKAPLLINRSSFQGVSSCTLQFTAQNPIPGNVDPTPSDNTTSVTLEVTLQ